MVRRYKWTPVEISVDEYVAVGKTSGERLGWLGDFVSYDVTDVAARVRAARELQTFVLMQSFDGGQYDIRQFAGEFEVPVIQAIISTLYHGLTPGESVWLNEPPLKSIDGDVAIGNGLTWHEGRGIVLATRASGLSLIFAAVADLLIAVGPRLRRCKTASCQRLFAANRPAQIRCRKSCGVTERVRQWRRDHPEQHTETRHQQYAKTVTKRLPGARVARRPKRA